MEPEEKEAFLLAEEEKLKNPPPPVPGEEPEEPRDWTPYKYAPFKT